MNAIILCAGSAQRFYEGDGGTRPKCLLPLGEETILDRLLHQLRARDCSVVLGTGCGHQLVAQHVEHHDGVRCIFNPDFATTNSIVTLWKARDFVTDETLLINGDLVVGHSAFDAFTDTPEPQLLVKHLDTFDDDTYRVVFSDRLEVIRMGKEITDSPSPNCAAFTGISRVGNSVKFLQQIETLLHEGTNQTWPTTAYANLLGKVPVHARDIGELLFYDIDTAEEHEAAQASSGEW